jgi:DEAD/DEAH box helicase domain-containing protein
MAANVLVWDLETQKSFDEVGGRDKNHLLKVSVVGVYSYLQNKYLTFTEDQLQKMGELFSTADLLIGFNTINFDNVVVQPYLNFKIADIPCLDILAEVEKVIGHRVKLDNLAQTTLGVGKSGDGLQALKYYKLGQMEELKKYCLDDVRITKELYDYVLKYNKLLYKDYFETREIQIKFPEAKPRKPTFKQTSLF